MERFNNKKLVLLYLLLSVAPLAVTISQKLFGLNQESLLSLAQIPYIVIIFFSLLMLARPNFRTFLISIMVIIQAFIINTLIALYNFGVESDWWSSAIHNRQLHIEFFKISMSGWNFIYTWAAASLATHVTVKYIKAKAKSGGQSRD